MAKLTHEDAVAINSFQGEMYINGTDSADEIDTTAGSIEYNISAGNGNDTIFDINGSYIDGGDGDDLIYAGKAGWYAKQIDGGNGNDVITIFDHAYDSTISGGAGNDTVYGGPSTDLIYGLSGNDYLYGRGGNDIINGNDGHDTLIGGNGFDRLGGGTGNDTLIGGVGHDEIKGGDGYDVAVFNIHSDDVIGYENANGSITIYSTEGVDTISEIETLQFTNLSLSAYQSIDYFSNKPLSKGNQYIVSESLLDATGTDINDTFTLGYVPFGSDPFNIHAKAGDDYIDIQHNLTWGYVDGGSGIDTIRFVFHSNDIDGYIKNNDSLIIYSDKNKHEIKYIENIVLRDFSGTLNEFTEHFKDFEFKSTTIIGQNSFDNLYGTASDDTFFSGKGRDIIDGQNGTDTAILRFDTTEVIKFSHQNNEVYLEGDDYWAQYTLRNIEKFQFNDQTLDIAELENVFKTVNTKNQTYIGDSLNNTFVLGLGNDYVDGMSGTDTVSIDVSSDEITNITSTHNIIKIDSPAGTDTFKNVEVFQFKDLSLQSEELLQQFGVIEPIGKTFYATAAHDQIVGTTGEDTVVFDHPSTEVIGYDLDSEWLDNLYSVRKEVITGKTSADTFISIENFQFTDKTVPADELYKAFDHVIRFNTNVINGSNDDNDELIGTDQDDTVYGFGGNDTISTGKGNDYINGGEGDDVIYAGNGDDKVYGEEGVDIAHLNITSSDIATVGRDGVASYVSIESPEGRDIFYDVEYFIFLDKAASAKRIFELFSQNNVADQELYGTPFDDNIVGGAGGDTFYDSLGSDHFDGGLGSNTVVFDFKHEEMTGYDRNNQFRTINHGNENDQISNIEYVQFANAKYTIVELDKLVAHSQTIYGTWERDTIYGGSADDIILPSKSDDFIDGWKGVDTVILETGMDDVKSFFSDGSKVIIESSEGVDEFHNIEKFQFNDTTLTTAELHSKFSLINEADQSLNGDNSANVLIGALGNDTMTPMGGDDIVDGAEGNDTVVLAIKTDQVTSYTNTNKTITLVSAEGTDSFNNIEKFQFLNKIVSLDELVFVFSKVNTASQTVIGNDEANDLFGGLGDDTLSPKKGDDLVDGVSGDNTAILDINSSEVKGYSNDGVNIVLTSTQGIDTFTNISQFKFHDKTIELVAMDKAFALVTVTSKTVEGDDGDNTLIGALANDTITPRGGNDDINGAAGEDTVILNIASTDFTDYSIDDNGVVTISSPEGQDRFENVEIFQFLDKTIKLIDLDEALSTLLVKELTFTSTPLNDAFVGGESDDLAIFGFATSDLISVIKHDDQYSIAGTEGIDTVSNIESLQFTDKTIKTHDLIIGSKAADLVIGTNVDDIIDAGNGIDQIKAGSGDDLIIGNQIGDTVDGGLGIDLAKFQFSQSDVTAVMRKLDGSVELSTAQGKSILDNVEKISFTDTDTIDIDTFINSQNPLMPIFNAIVQGKKVAATPEKYNGAVDFLEYQLLGNAEGNVVTGSEFNDFLNLLDGDDAANGGAGRDVLDGGTGSNFLTGGDGDDTFFLDGRGGSTTWSTITDFDGDNVNIWGWIDGTSQLLISEENAGAYGFKGATLHFDLNNDGDIDTSITFSGLALNEVPEGISNMVEENGYLLFS